MKFGKYLDKVKARHPEWAAATLSYASLKRMLKELNQVTLPQKGMFEAHAEVASLTVPPRPSLSAKYDGLEVREIDFFREVDKEVRNLRGVGDGSHVTPRHHGPRTQQLN
jgi:hypothetical protein